MKWLPAVALIALCAQPASVASAPALSTSTPARVSSPGAIAAKYCPVGVVVIKPDGAGKRYPVYLTALRRGRANGTISFYAGDARYDVPFHDFTLAPVNDETAAATVMIVEFPVSTTIDSAYVSALSDGTTGLSCSIPFNPWRRPFGTDRNPATSMRDTKVSPWLTDAIAAAPTIAAPIPIDDPVSCTTPDRVPRTLKAAPPQPPGGRETGVTQVLVVIDERDHILGTMVRKSSGSTELDGLAVDAVNRSQFRGATFRCRPAVGLYLFTVGFQ